MPDGIVERMAKKVPLGTPDTVAPVFPLRGAFGANLGSVNHAYGIFK